LQTYFPDETSNIIFRSSFIPSPCLAAAGITGTPSSFDNVLSSISIPFRLTSSIKLRQTTARSVISKICKTRFKFLSTRVASTTITVTSGCPNKIKSRATSSSVLVDKSEYVPGRSTTLNFFSLYSNPPSALVTVLPGQLPVCCLNPVK